MVPPLEVMNKLIHVLPSLAMSHFHTSCSFFWLSCSARFVIASQTPQVFIDPQKIVQNTLLTPVVLPYIEYCRHDIITQIDSVFK